MRYLVTGSAGHLGEGLMRILRARGEEAVGLDCLPSPFTDVVGSITDAALVASAMRGIDAVLHTATLHKPHVATHSRQDFVDTNITGTLTLLEAARDNRVGAFVFTSSTSAFGDAMAPKPEGPAVWIDETVTPVPKNIYGATKLAAEDLCQLFARNEGVPTIVLRTSRFFPEDDDNRQRRDRFDQDNLKVCELLYRRVDVADAAEAHLLAAHAAPEIGHKRYIVSAPSPFTPDDLGAVFTDAASLVFARIPEAKAVFDARGWVLPASLDRVYDSRRAIADLGWMPAHDFRAAIRALERGEDYRSDLAREIGQKGYHDVTFQDGPYPVVEN